MLLALILAEIPVWQAAAACMVCLLGGVCIGAGAFLSWMATWRLR